MIILAIDPGNTQTAWVIYAARTMKVIDKGLQPNEDILTLLQGVNPEYIDHVIIEYPQPRGQPMYTQVVDTIFWIGRFAQVLDGDIIKFDRKDVKMELCGSTRAGDPNVNAAVRSRFSNHPNLGGGKTPEKGTKAQPGPLYGVSKDIWAALAVALAWTDMHDREQKEEEFMS